MDRRGLLEGLGVFVDDIDVQGLLHCQFVRSVVAHATITEVDTSMAKSASGVHAVLTGEVDLGMSPIPGQGRHGPPAPHMSRPPLARDRVRYVGEPVAMVVADSAARAADAAELVGVDYTELAAVVDPREAVCDQVIIFEDAGSNVVHREESIGAISELDPEIEVTVEVVNQRVAPLPLEPLGMLAVPSAGHLHLVCGHQAPHRLRSQIAGMLGIKEKDIRVSVPNVGGGFGAKGMLYPEYIVVAAAARRLGRPLKWVATRREDLAASIHGRAQIHRLTLGGDRSGRVRRARVEILAEMGAYPHNGSMIPGFTRFMATGPYRIEEVSISTTMVVTNCAPIGTYRGAGRPEATYALERAMDAYAATTGIDPIELRRVNLIPEEDFPHETFSGALYDSGRYLAALDRALEMVDMESVRRAQAMNRRTSQRRIGVGVGFYLERAGGPLTEGEHASVDLVEKGELLVRVGAVDTGQGHERVWKAIAGRPFGLSPEAIEVLSGDTEWVAEGVGTFASRSTQVCGSVVKRCAETLFARVREVAASMLEVAPEDLRARHGRFEVVDNSDSSVDLGAVRNRAAETGVSLHVAETWIPGAHTFPYGVHIAVVEVDPQTGDVRLLRAIAVDDCGTVVDPAGALGQVHGSIAQGAGQARCEAVKYGADGQLLTSTLMDYLAPRAPDLPSFETSHLVTPTPTNPLGAKGVGESGCIGFPPAFVAAVADAIGHPGESSLDMPLQPEIVWTAATEPRGAGRSPAPRYNDATPGPNSRIRTRQ